MIESNNNLSSNGGVIDTWSYTPKNTLMYIPEGVPLTFEEKLELEKQAKIIKHENTRFTAVPFDFKKQKETLETLSEARLSQLSGKMGVDGKELVSKETPKVNGFGFVAATPSPVPGRLAGDESPMMTWGEIDSTPFRLDPNGSATPSFSYHSGNGPEFKIPDIPEREKIALNLEEKANAARRKTKLDALKHVQRRIASPSVDSSKGSLSDRYHVMSPAAQRLLSSKLNIRPGSSSGKSTPRVGSLTPSPGLSKQSFSPHVVKFTSPSFKKPVLDSLTDNLLKLPKKT
jgi:protein DGCR14